MNLLGVQVDLGTPVLSASVDLSAVVAEVTTGTIVGGGGLVTLDLDNGDVIIDLEMLHADGLNDLDENTQLLTSEEIGRITTVLNDMLGDIVGDVTDAVNTAVNATELRIVLDPTVDALLVEGDLDIALVGTIGGFLGQPGAAAPTFEVAGSLTINLVITQVTLDIGNLLGPLTNLILPRLLAAVGGAIALVLTAGQQTLTTTLNGLVNPLLNTLSPLLSQVLDQIVDITINSQTTDEIGRFYARALLVEVLPGANVVALPLASSMVRVAAASVATSLTPTEGPQTGGTEVTITGSGFAGATGVDFGGVPGTSFTLIDDNTIRVTTPRHAAGSVDVVVRHPNGDSNALRFTYRSGIRPGLPDTGAPGDAGLVGALLLLAGSAGLVGAATRRRRS